MAYQSPTPADIGIPVRDLRFTPAGGRRQRWWHGGRPVPTAFFNALSCTFPAGEKFFMDSVRRFRREAGARLASQIQGFIGQEAVHSREHAAFNALAGDGRILPDYLTYHRPGFHPWQHDDRALLARAATTLGVPAAAPAIAA